MLIKKVSDLTKHYNKNSKYQSFIKTQNTIYTRWDKKETELLL